MASKCVSICFRLAALVCVTSTPSPAQGDACVRFLSPRVECDPADPGRAVVTLQVANGTAFEVDRIFFWPQSAGLVVTPDEFFVPPIAPGEASAPLRVTLQNAPAPAAVPCVEVSIHNSATEQCCLRTQLCPDLGDCRQGPVVRRADANLDNKQDISDAVKILSFLFLGDPATTCIDTMDADDNAAVEITDAIVILTHLFLGGRPPAAPYPGCGTDPTEDSLPCESYPHCT